MIVYVFFLFARVVAHSVSRNARPRKSCYYRGSALKRGNALRKCSRIDPSHGLKLVRQLSPLVTTLRGAFH